VHILVTGGLGFVGRATIPLLVERGHSVSVLDQAAGPGPSLPDAELIVGDVRDQDVCMSALAGVDAVLHCAAIHHAHTVSRDPVDVIGVNIGGTINMLTSAQRQGISRFVFLSTAKVYGEPAGLPSGEEDMPRPIESYGLSKALAETYCERFGLDSIVLRPFSVYGPGQDLSTGYVGMTLKATPENGNPLVLPGKSSFVRDFIYIDDMARICAEALEVDSPKHRLLNAGSGMPHTLAQLVEIASGLVGRELPVEYREPHAGTITRTHADTRQLSSTLGFDSFTSLRQGMESTIAWFLDSPGRGEVDR